MKEIHLIGHAESEANAAIDVDNPTNYFDAIITEKGKLQAQKKYEEYNLNYLRLSLKSTQRVALLLVPTTTSRFVTGLSRVCHGLVSIKKWYDLSSCHQ